MTHTASLAGSAAASSALLMRLGFVEVRSIGVFLETLKLMHFFGPLPGGDVVSVSCSGGEASLMADMAEGSALNWRDFTPVQYKALKDELGQIVTVANPLDYHTFIWGDTARMTRVFADVMRDRFDLAIFVLDLPRADRCDPSGYQCAVDAIIAAKAETGVRVAVLTSLPENLSEAACAAFTADGIVPLHGMEEAIASIDAAIKAGQMRGTGQPRPVLLSNADSSKSVVLSEAQSKAALAKFGLKLPRSVLANSPTEAAKASLQLTFPVVLKGLGIAHKSEAGVVALHLTTAGAVETAAAAMTGVDGLLVEEMAVGGVAEILAGVTRDPTGLMLLTVGAGGVMTELLADAASVLLPTTAGEIEATLRSLKVSKLLQGFRGKPAADMHKLVEAIQAIGEFAVANCDTLLELDVNPIIARPHDAIAVDALIRISQE